MPWPGKPPSMREVAGLIAQDVGMSAGILKLVNSAFFGLRVHVSSPAHAVNLLGLEIVKALVLGVGLFDRFNKGSLPRLRPGKTLEPQLRHGPSGPPDRHP